MTLGEGGEAGYLSSHITPFKYERPASALADVGILGNLEPIGVLGQQAAKELADRLGQGRAMLATTEFEAYELAVS